MTHSETDNCPFCLVEHDRIVDENELAIAIADAYPVSRGHLLCITRRHVANFFDLSNSEVLSLMDLLFRVQSRLAAEFTPDGFNIGINVGMAGGQTVMHVHIHLIPRYLGDVSEPRGGIRNVIPGMGPYPQF